jgi:cation diffusion facilitator family transporter
VAAAQLVASLSTGSSAMLAESIHSVIDSGNEVLLLIGLRRSARPPDEDHPFGHGKELYFWSLLVALLLFAVGGVVSIAEGILRFSRQREQVSPVVNYLVLATAAVFEGSAWVVALRQFNPRRELSLIEQVRRSKDPSIYTVIVEDSSALLGLVIAFGGVLGEQLGVRHADAIASVLIGAMLCVVALFLIQEARRLLVGERARREVIRSVHRIAARDPDVVTAQRPLTMQLGPGEVLVNMGVELRSELKEPQVVSALERISGTVRRAHPEVRYIFIQPQGPA